MTMPEFFTKRPAPGTKVRYNGPGYSSGGVICTVVEPMGKTHSSYTRVAFPPREGQKKPKSKNVPTGRLYPI